jgi:hypothetical protein
MYQQSYLVQLHLEQGTPFHYQTTWFWILTICCNTAEHRWNTSVWLIKNIQDRIPHTENTSIIKVTTLQGIWQHPLTLPTREADGRLTHCEVMGFILHAFNSNRLYDVMLQE